MMTGTELVRLQCSLRKKWGILWKTLFLVEAACYSYSNKLVWWLRLDEDGWRCVGPTSLFPWRCPFVGLSLSVTVHVRRMWFFWKSKLDSKIRQGFSVNMISIKFHKGKSRTSLWVKDLISAKPYPFRWHFCVKRWSVKIHPLRMRRSARSPSARAHQITTTCDAMRASTKWSPTEYLSSVRV